MADRCLIYRLDELRGGATGRGAMLAQGGQVALAVVSSLLLLWQQAASIEVPQDRK